VVRPLSGGLRWERLGNVNWFGAGGSGPSGVCVLASLSPLLGWLLPPLVFPRLAPWAAFYRRFAAARGTPFFDGAQAGLHHTLRPSSVLAHGGTAGREMRKTHRLWSKPTSGAEARAHSQQSSDTNEFVPFPDPAREVLSLGSFCESFAALLLSATFLAGDTCSQVFDCAA
jgi:hypothetical protein